MQVLSIFANDHHGWKSANSEFVCEVAIGVDQIRPRDLVFLAECFNRFFVVGGNANNFDGNNLTGTIPKLDLPFLKTFVINGNDLSGPAPDLSGLPKLERLGLSFNNFTGPLPPFEPHPNLRFVRASFNAFTGPIPDISGVNNLNALTLSNNQLEGCYPEAICDLSVFHALDNTQLPWNGDHSDFCNGLSDLGAPCTRLNGLQGAIDEDCNCAVLSSILNEINTNLKLFPNPVNNTLNIAGPHEISTYKIYNALGQLIIEQKATGNYEEIMLAEAGLYVVMVETERGVWVEKVVVE